MCQWPEQVVLHRYWKHQLQKEESEHQCMFQKIHIFLGLGTQKEDYLWGF